MEKVLTYRDVVRKFEVTCNKCIVVACKHSFGTTLVILENLELCEYGDSFCITDINDTEITIFKSSIKSVYSANESFDEEIIFDLGNSAITFVIGN